MKRGTGYLQFIMGALICLSFGMFTTPAIRAAETISGDQTHFVADELLVRPKDNVAKQKVHEILTSLGASTADEISQIRVKRIKVPARNRNKVEAALAKNPHIQFVEKNFIARAGKTPNDPYFTNQWHHKTILGPEGWEISIGSQGVPIAIIDSGVDPAHSDLKSKLITGYNFLAGNTDTQDVLGHGTAVAGCAAAASDNLNGVAGVAWQNPIMPLVVLNSSNYASYYDIARAINYAADRGVRVINVSIGGSSASSTLQNAADYAWKKGCILFASAMNNATSTPYYPAACTNVVAVSATTSGDTPASFTNYGNWIDVSAPGASIYTTKKGGGYSYWNGTSFASPITAGLAALILSTNPALTNSQVVDILIKNADDLGASGFDSYYGHGRINAYRSLLAAASTLSPVDRTAPSVSITSPGDGSDVKSTVSVNVSAGDDVKVTEVCLFIDGYLYGSVAAAPYTYVWDTTRYSDGSHTLKAVAYDSSGNKGESAVTKVDVLNTNNAPAIQIVGPVDSSLYYTGTSITFTGWATDTEDGGLTAEMSWKSSIDGLIGQGGSFSRTLSAGNHTITASVTDSAGILGSSSVNVVVESMASPLQVQVSGILYSTAGGRNNDKILYTTVTLTDDTGSAVSGASVSINLLCNSGNCGSWSYRGSTDAKGQVLFTLKDAPSGCYTTQVTSVTTPGLAWNNLTPANRLCK